MPPPSSPLTSTSRLSNSGTSVSADSNSGHAHPTERMEEGDLMKAEVQNSVDLREKPEHQILLLVMIRRSTNRIRKLWKSDGTIIDDSGGIHAEILHFFRDR
ncbi:hypothetical protein COCNU_scaffold009721G000010 [Cocos nucifera]|nr:hypothetical protein [Cocos nucifera]